LGSGAIDFLDGSDDRKEVLHPGELKQLKDAWAHSCRNQPNPLTLAPNIVTNHHAEAGRIHIGDLIQIEDMNSRLSDVRR